MWQIGNALACGASSMWVQIPSFTLKAGSKPSQENQLIMIKSHSVNYYIRICSVGDNTTVYGTVIGGSSPPRCADRGGVKASPIPIGL